jgi:hypothetical protein
MRAVLEGEGNFSLWKHCVMVFGSKAAVWAYNRVGDAIIFLFRVLFFGVCFHYVDDYGGVEPEELANSAFIAFKRFSALLGFKIKASKEQPPAGTQIMLGVNTTIGNDQFITEILKTRRKQMVSDIVNMIKNQIVTSKQAQTLSGKSVFTNASTFGALGAAALRPLYRRASYGGTEIDTDINASLHMIMFLLIFAPPKVSPLTPPRSAAPMLYADAYFTYRGVTKKVSDFADIQDFADPSATSGWGTVIIRGKDMWHFSGAVPNRVFSVIKKKKTYIFLLEVIAQCMGIWFMAPELGPNFWAFVDNVGAEFALRKGFSRDRDANAVISLFWSAAAVADTRPWFERVPSKAQLADEVSRGDDTMLVRMGSRRMDFNYDKVWDTVIDMVEKGGLADHNACTDMLSSISVQRMRLGLPRLDSDGMVLK